jgi:hypothetical protein
MRDIYKSGLTDGTEEVNVADTLAGHGRVLYMFQFTVRDSNGDVAAPAAGTATLKPTLSDRQPTENVASNSVDLTNRDNWMQEVTGSYHTFDVVIASLTANHTVDVTIHPVRA